MYGLPFTPVITMPVETSIVELDTSPITFRMFCTLLSLLKGTGALLSNPSRTPQRPAAEAETWTKKKARMDIYKHRIVQRHSSYKCTQCHFGQVNEQHTMSFQMHARIDIG
jgi:hypothetical protein